MQIDTFLLVHEWAGTETTGSVSTSSNNIMVVLGIVVNSLPCSPTALEEVHLHVVWRGNRQYIGGQCSKADDDFSSSCLQFQVKMGSFTVKSLTRRRQVG